MIQKFKKPLLWLPLILLTLSLFLIPARKDDIWWRLHFGNQIFNTSKVPQTNSTSWSSPNHPWIDHSWGYDLTVSQIEKFSSIKGVALLHIFLLLIVGFITLKSSKLKDLSWSIPGLFLLLGHHALRPYVFGDLFFVMLFFLTSRLKTNSKTIFKPLLLYFIFFVIWSNFHGSSIAGWFMGAALLLTTNRKKWPIFIALTGVSFAALFINPYGYRAPIEGLKYMAGLHPFLPKLEEWSSPSLFVILFLMLFSGGILKRIYDNKPSIKNLLIITGLFFLSIKSGRNIPLFLIFSVLLTGPPPLPKSYFTKFPTSIKSGVFSIFLIFSIFFYLFSSNSPQGRFYPFGFFKKVENISTGNKTYKVFTLHLWSGALTWHFNGKMKPYIDARNDCYPFSVFEKYNTISKIKPGWKKLFKSNPPDLVMIPKNHPLEKQLLLMGWTIKLHYYPAILLIPPTKPSI
jgi:hypothetical protein